MTDSSRLRIRRFVGGPLLTTCYAVIAPGNASVIIDAPKKAWQSAIDAANEAGAPVQLAIATHGDWDHISDLSEVQSLGIPVAGHPADARFFREPMAGRTDLPFVIEPVDLDRRLADGDRITVGDLAMQIIHTPGHTPGGVCIWIPDAGLMFTGDTLLKSGAGYLDRPECDAVALATSIRRIAEYPAATKLYPGHGAPTTIGEETWLEDAHDPDTLIGYWRSGQRRWKPPQGVPQED